MFGMFDTGAPKNGSEKGNGGSPSGLDDYPEAEQWDRITLLGREKQALGCYVSGHPLLRYGDKLSRIGAVPAGKVADQQAWTVVTVAGMVENYQEKLFKGGTGGKAAFFEIEDMSGRVKAKVRSERIETYGAVSPVANRARHRQSQLPHHGRAGRGRGTDLLMDEAVPLSDAVRKATRQVLIHLDADGTRPEQLRSLKTLLLGAPGACPVDVVLDLPEGARAVLGLDGVRVDPSDAVLAGLERLFGDSVAELR